MEEAERPGINVVLDGFGELKEQVLVPQFTRVES